MLPLLIVTAGLLVQAPARVPEPVRVWRIDSIAHVTLRRPGHLLVLHVDAIGRIEVLYPITPDDSFTISQAPIALPLPPTAEGNPATFLAVWSRWPFDFAALRWGSWWDYRNALLLQPTAGDPLAALLEIADRVTDGRPYDYGVATYARDGTVSTRREPIQPEVCLGCVRRGPPVVAARAPVTTNSVDCSNASLTNSFCGVATGSVSITSVSTPAAQAVHQPPPAPVYVPYYVPLVVHAERPRFQRPPTPSPVIAPRSSGVAYPIAPRRVVPSTAEVRAYGNRPRR